MTGAILQQYPVKNILGIHEQTAALALKPIPSLAATQFIAKFSYVLSNQYVCVCRWYEMDKFCSGNLSSSLGSTALITGVSFPAASQGYQFWSHKVTSLLMHICSLCPCRYSHY